MCGKRPFINAGHPSGNWLVRLDGRVKLALLIAALLLNLLAASWHVSALLMLGGLILTLAARVAPRLLGRRLLMPGILALVALLTQLVWVDSGEVVTRMPLLFWHWTITADGVQRGIELALRILAGMSVLLWFALSTPLPELMRAARWFRCPEILVELCLIMYRYIFLLFEEANRIRNAQRSRLGFAGARSGLRSAGILGGMLLLRSFDRAERSFAAMRSRGYSGRLSATLPRSLQGSDWMALTVGILLLGGIYGLR